MKSLRITVFIAICFVLSGRCTSLLAQVQTENGRIQGDVTDSGGAAIPGAAVTALEVNTGVKIDSRTDGSGHFEFPSLKPGQYQVTIIKDGFAPTIQKNLTLTVGLTTTLRLALRVGGVSEEVVVTAAPLIDVTTTASTSTRLTSMGSAASSTIFRWMAVTTTTASLASNPAGSARRWTSRWKR